MAPPVELLGSIGSAGHTHGTHSQVLFTPSTKAPVRAPDDAQVTGGSAGGSQFEQYIRIPLTTVPGSFAKVVPVLISVSPDTSPVVLRVGAV